MGTISLAEVYHFDLYGSRKHKYDVLSANSLSSLAWNKIACRAPEYFFIAKDIEKEEAYKLGISIAEIFQLFSSGISSHRDMFVIDKNKETLRNRIKYFSDKNNSDNTIYSNLQLKDTSSWKVSKVRENFEFHEENIQEILYRPFDCQYIYYDPCLIDRGREKIMKNLLKKDNFSFNCLRQSRSNEIGTFLISNNIVCKDAISLLDRCSTFPLYLYPEITTQQSTEETNHRTPNLNQKLVKQIAENLGLIFTDEKETAADTFAPIDILDYIYAVLHSPNYRATYKEFLKIDFPRVPYPNINTFWQLVKLGSELRLLHLLERNTNQGLYSSYPIDGDNNITRKLNKHDFEITDNEKQYGRVWINNTQYFDNVPLTAWAFYIGGYQPAQKWLKDRHGRVLTIEDIKHYQKIINALIETDRIMKAIDLIELN